MVNLYKLLSGKGTFFAFALALVAMIIFAVPVLNGLDSFNALPTEQQKTSNIFNMGIVIMLLMLVVAVVITVLWSVIHVAMNPAGAKMGLIWLAVIVGLFALGYFVLNAPDNQAILDDLKTNEVSANMSKLLGGGIWLMLLMLLGAVAIFIFSEIRNLFK
ncbi:MAG TPA: hypothetical protein PKM27_08380 [Saprospiraceae bacterium]|nr:hypothetical protein [Saprospiraceae bacterium]HNT20150.1 hypothetical protein [Saprospiraceae bacterium]